MGTNIPYLDSTLRTVGGCTRCSPGCAHCWSVNLTHRMAHNPLFKGRFAGLVENGDWTGKVITLPENLDKPLHARKPRRIGVDFYADLFHPAVSDAWIDRVFAVMLLSEQHRFYVLTKRAARMRDYMTAKGLPSRWSEAVLAEAERAELKMRRHDGGINPAGIAERWREGFYALPEQIRLGVSVCNQQEADERIPLLLATPAAFRWVSIEPMLGEVDLRKFIGGSDGDTQDGLRPGGSCAKCGLEMEDGEKCECPEGFGPTLDWVVCGAESGPGRRPMPWSWAERIVEQCRVADVACWVKQLDAGNLGVITPTHNKSGAVTWPAWAKQEQPK